VAASAESLPFENQSFDAAMAFATVHHWRDPIAGLREMQRVASRVACLPVRTLTEVGVAGFGSLVITCPRSLLPVSASLLRWPARSAPGSSRPWDCVDGFFEAYWRRPSAYLDENVRRGTSVWASVGPDAERTAVRRLGDDLNTGRWAERNRALLDLEAAELGLRLLIA
jgi:SAM-dependent methyltransferase